MDFLVIFLILSQMESVRDATDVKQTVAQECTVRRTILAGLTDDATTTLVNRPETRLILLT